MQVTARSIEVAPADHPPAPASFEDVSVDAPPEETAFIESAIAGADRHFSALSAHQRQFFRCIRAVDESRVWEADGCRDIAQWISGRYHVPTYQARLWADAAHSLEQLPLISNAFGTGEMSIDKTVQLARFATPATEKDLLPWAKRVTVRTIRRKADLARRPSAEEERTAETEVDLQRSLTWWLCHDDKLMWIEALLPAAEGMKAVTVIDRLASRAPRDPDIAGDIAGYAGDTETRVDERTLDHRRADAFVELCSQGLDADFDADRATVVVHAELDALRNDGAGAEIDDGPVVSGGVLRQLACDARVELVVSDGPGGVVGIGRASRTPPAWLYRQVLRRDGGCTFPGCGTRRYIAAHHVVHWENGGPTELDNLTIACGFHHRLIHTRAWDVKLSGSGEATWFKPDGSIYEPRGPTGAYS